MVKKLTLIIASIVIFSAISVGQNLVFQHRDGTAIEDNSTVYFNTIDEYDYLRALVDLKNISTSEVSVSFTLEILEKTNVTGISCCAFPTDFPLCVAVEDTYSPAPFTLVPDQVLDFDIYVTGGPWGEILDPDNFHLKMKYTVSIAKEEHVIYVIFTSNQTNIIDTASQKNNYVSQYGNLVSLNYHFNADADRILNVYDITGRKIKQLILSNNSGIIQLPNSPKGIYLYSITENGSVAKSGKYIVR